MTIPRDLLDEVEMELAATSRSSKPGRARAAALEELWRAVVAATHDLGRPVTVFEFIASAKAPDERERRLALVRQLRERCDCA